MKVLLLCHGRRHRYPTHKPCDDLCGTSGLTRDTLNRVRLTTLDINKRAKPDIVQDITVPIQKRGIVKKYDVISNMYAPYFIFINPCTGGFIAETFTNLANMLKNGGYIVFAVADEGIEVFMHQYKLLTSRLRREFGKCMMSDEYNRRLYRFIHKFVSKAIARRLSRLFPEFRPVEGCEKQKLLMTWNRTHDPLYDEHDLVVLKFYG